MSKLPVAPETELEGTPTGAGEFRKLLDTFCTQLSNDGLKVLSAFCEQSKVLTGIQQIPLESGLHAAHLLSVLVDHKLVTQDNLQLLSFVARSCGQTKILEAVTQFARSRPVPIESLPPDFEQRCSHGTVTCWS